MHVGGAEGGQGRAMKEEARERGEVKDNGEKKSEREGWVENGSEVVERGEGKAKREVAADGSSDGS